MIPAPLRLTGTRVTDAAVLGALAVAVPLIAARARRGSWFTSLGLAALVVVSGASLVAVGGGLLAAVLGTVRRMSQRQAGLLVGIALIQALVHAEPGKNALPLAAAGTLALATLAFSAYRVSNRRRRRGARRVAGALALGFVALGLLLAVALLSARSPLSRGIDQLDVGLAAAHRGDSDAAASAFDDAAASLRTARSNVGAWWAQPVRSLPLLGRNVAVVDAALSEAVQLADDARAAAAAVGPERLKFTTGSVDLAAIRVATPVLERAADDAAGAIERLAQLRSPWLVSPVSSRLDQMSARIERNLGDLALARDAVGAAPDLLGELSPRRYLVVFVTPVEARGTGFPGNFAELNVDHGHMSLGRFGRISELTGNQGKRTVTAPADYTARYGFLDVANEWRDLTVSPDFPTVARLMGQLYPQSGGMPVDGVLRLDPVAVAAMLQFTGPITVPDVPFALTSDNTAKFLFEDQYTTLANPNRIDALDELGHLVFEKLVSANLPGPGELAKVFSPLVDQGHLAFVRLDGTDSAASVALLDRVGATGAAPPVRGDSLGVVVNNAGGNKTDAFLTRDVDYHATVEPTTGLVHATATVRLTNGAPGSGLPGVIIDNYVAFFNPGMATPPKGTNRTWLTVYTPLALTGATLDGQPTTPATAVELGRLAHSLFIDLAPGATREVTLTLTGTVSVPYQLDIWRQALAKPGTAVVSIDTGSGPPAATTLTLDEDRTINAR
ncbi:MAG: DUF4012 domain-containing protein [Acidimicrobiales bacterium]